ncbi:response regulator [Streptomyces rubiginosohelvolus]|uniref:response regulator n=1 Tax=Streptomyces TaxID=1883 RepID=UPI0004C51A79|nr:response regulator transcription factor [Streptomyces griseus]WSF76147.1 response regulator transcription factor [Streptomyces globisporus]WST56167.1 response regulator transcription factor [Streptomyces rubiginosohelvolus]
MVIRVLVADDQAVVRTAFSGLLNTQDDIEVVGEAEDGEQAVLGAAELRPDVALLDIRMPRLGGIDAAREIVAASNGATKALMLTTFGLDEYVYDALTAGASGFLLKDATFPELLHAVRVVAGGHALLAPEITGRLIAEFARQRVSAPPKRSIDGLTAREAEVLVLIARGLSNADIADRLTITDHTVKTHINRLFAKMRLRDRAQAVILAYELGLVVAGNSGP